MPQNQNVSGEKADRNIGMTSRVVNGSLWNVGGQMGVMIASFLATSFVIRLLGTESYGAWSLIILINGYATQSDLGMGTASTRFGSESFAQGDQEKENKIIWTAFLIAMVPSLILSASLAIFAKPIISNLLKIPEHLQTQVAWALILISFGFSFRVAGNIFNTPQLVRLRMDINALIVSGLLILQISLTPLAIWIWGGIIPAAATIASFSFFTLMLLFAASQKLLPRLKRPSFDFSLAKPLVVFGGTLVLSSVAGLILGTIEKPLLARYASVTTLAHYAVASTLASVMSIFPIAISQPLLPAFTQLYVSGSTSALKSLYDRAVRGNLMWSLPMAHFLCVIAKPFFTIWAGEEFGREATIPLYILVIGLVVNVFSYVPYILLQASGRGKLILKIYCIEIIPYIFLSAYLASWYGANGVAIAWSLRILADAIILFICVKPILGKVSDSFLKVGAWYWGTFLFIVLSTVLVIEFVSSLLPLIACSMFLLLIYSLILVTRILEPDEKKWLFGKSRALWAGFRRKIASAAKIK